ncbi:SDR family oxidoreductase [Prosthecobacter dejongeii]|uniref:3-oxoacyl-[acyl-carrier protein] reductase n=1 Tax=Prosthecobacter dejongeii TaxID=48465 RepID=A0A7W7YPF4_9BACT|nr:SDR family oxidoreductase [Prosthecobacter dejongeii]MBB5039940.1 3-oxoacyl-[acyl-carrier protein] reductase [Prosthecobacter dejongeii]
MIEAFKQGMVFSEEVHLSPEFVERFAEFSGDRNPVHLKTDAARGFGYARPIAHGAIQTAIVSRLIGMKVPGPGAVWMSQSMEWTKPIFVGETVRIEAEIMEVSTGASVLHLALRGFNKQSEPVMTGQAKVKMATSLAVVEATPKQTETRVALVTGGSRGIGAATAIALAEAGFHVAISYHSNQAAAEEISHSIREKEVRCQAYSIDLSKEDAAEELTKRVIRDFGSVDVIVHCASQPLKNLSVQELSPTDYRDCWRVHVGAATALVKAAAPGMIERRFGRFIFLGTSYLFGPPPAKLAAYVSAKQALWGAVRCMAQELGPQQITTNMISPGMTVTELTDNVPARLKEAEARKVPLRRLAVPEDVASVVAFLASDASAYMNGQNIPLTGGPV